MNKLVIVLLMLLFPVLASAADENPPPRIRPLNNTCKFICMIQTVPTMTSEELLALKVKMGCSNVP